jgi:dTDP-4-dehydrorhamnose reductase
MKKLDVRSRPDIAAAVAGYRPELLVHLAAETDVEVCDARPDHAWETNALGTKHVALAALEADVPLAYVSTAGVFDGEKVEPYVEYDAAFPINYYGRSKLEGERYVQTFLSRFYVVRAGWMVGGGPKDHKFVAKMLEQINSGAKTLYAVGDKLGTPTYAPDFAACFARLIASRSYGLYHMACKGRASRFDVAKKILQVLGRTEVEVVEVGSSFFAESYPTPRPRSEMMRNLMLDLQGMNSMRDWELALEEYLETAFADLRVVTAIA